MPESPDMTMGIWRKVFAALLHGRRINSVSDAAELLFIRLQLLADDYGNLQGDPQLIKSNGFPRRGWSIVKIEKALHELLNTGSDGKAALISRYSIDGEPYLHIHRFETIQPGGRNGKRVRRYPKPPSGTESLESAGESAAHTPNGCIQVHPENPSQSMHTRPDQTKTRPDDDQTRPVPLEDSRGVGQSLAGGLGLAGLVGPLLERLGVTGPSAAAIAACPAVTVDEIKRDWREICKPSSNGRTPNSPAAVLVSRLLKRHGIVVAKGGKIDPAVALANERIKGIRRTMEGAH